MILLEKLKLIVIDLIQNRPDMKEF